MVMSEENEKLLIVQGKSCTLYNDPEKAMELENGELLIPWWSDNSVMIDRFDGRGYLAEVCEQDVEVNLTYEDYLSEEEIAIEKMCEFERYLELQVDIHEIAIQDEEARKRDAEKCRSQYGAVNFSYNSEESSNNNKAVEVKDAEKPDEQQIEEPYVCPSELKFLSHLRLPETDKQAQIIEKTAVFVARQGNQMEIVLKAKQHGNPLFGFLNFDHNLNPFYKEIVKLISRGRYFPKTRPNLDKPAGTLFSANDETTKSIHEDCYELKLPKVDISNTAYAALINKFKKVNEMALAASRLINPTNMSSEASSPDISLVSTEKSSSKVHKENDTKISDIPKDVKVKRTRFSDDTTVFTSSVASVTSATSFSIRNETDGNQSLNPLTSEEYDQCYQEYYRHYYAHYYTQFKSHVSTLTAAISAEEECFDVVQEAAKAAAVAAAAAVDAVQQTRLRKNTQTVTTNTLPSMTPEQRGIINKMAEYVVRNGLEFEELVTKQKMNDPRFAFLQFDHPLHSYYMAKRHELDPDNSLTKAADAAYKTSPHLSNSSDDDLTAKSQPSSTTIRTVEKKTSPDPSERQSCISFRLTRPNNSGKIRSGHTTESSAEMNTNSLSTPVLGETEIHLISSEYDEDDQLNSSKSPDNSRSNDNSDNSPQPRFIIPGIPSPSSSSCSPSSTSEPRSPSPVQSRSSTSSKSDSPLQFADFPDPCRKPPQIVNSQHTSVSTKDKPAVSLENNYNPSVTKTSSLDFRSTTSWSSCTIEDLLDIHEPTSILELSPKGYHTQVITQEDERIREDRRRRAAQLVSQLKLTASVSKTNSDSCSTISKTNSSNTSMNAYHNRINSPPPAPDSVPAAVAHAVVASLKRRQEASLELEAKARKRRSPPAAYALPRDRKAEWSPKSPSHNREYYPRTELWNHYDDNQSKRKKHKKSRL